MYYCEYAHLLKKRTEHICMSAIYYDEGSDIRAKQCQTIVTFDTILESKILFYWQVIGFFIQCIAINLLAGYWLFYSVPGH